MVGTIGTWGPKNKEEEQKEDATTPATNMNSILADLLRPSADNVQNSLLKTNITTRYDSSIRDLSKDPPNPEATARQIGFIQSHIDVRCSRLEELFKLEKQELSKDEDCKKKPKHRLVEKRTETERKLGIHSKSKPSTKNPLTPIRPEMRAELISKHKRRRSLSLFVRPHLRAAIDAQSTSPGPEFTRHGSGLRQPF